MKFYKTLKKKKKRNSNGRNPCKSLENYDEDEKVRVGSLFSIIFILSVVATLPK